MANSANFPTSVTGNIYPDNPNPQFPEQLFPAFNPANAIVGVAFSGGGARAMSAAMGQMRGLRNSLGYTDIGAISCVSGGSWFGTPFTYASSKYDDDTLLGLQTPPSQLTVEGLQNLNTNNICSALPQMTNGWVSAELGLLYLIGVPYNRLWSRMLNFFILLPLGIGDTNTFFTLNPTTLAQLLSLNPSLTPSNFYLQRDNRPFYIGGSTQAYPMGDGMVMRHFENTAMYTGTPQMWGTIGVDGQHFGYGYVDNLLFDTVGQGATGFDEVTANLNTNPENGQLLLFTLSDQMGSSSSAPGADLDYFDDNPDYFPQFNYWCPTYVDDPATVYSYVDGGDLENTGIIPLLRRQYPIVLAFVNTSLPLGGTDPYYYVDGVDAQISSLFGHYPEQNPVMPPIVQTQVLNDDGKFAQLAAALASKKANGEPLVYADLYTVYEGNYFGVPAYPGAGSFFIVWYYNDMNRQWYNELPTAIQELLTSTDPTNYMANFPNYATVGQNSYDDIPEVLMLTPQQINLLANMQCFTVSTPGNLALIKELMEKVASREAVKP
ncbi:hypothetical protein [Puia dinghuensis]|uniref:PNPLA domain-containing protein n=1 Tax=Puia dinghuensis TaxID=1792502 RepID=A0A8J2UHI9_9BACT|nr:hypothetical protein [Puia dinghuensis]GGB18319.1 hypothetical protein GCM10011511_47680 [Puia dinghuensis]